MHSSLTKGSCTRHGSKAFWGLGVLCTSFMCCLCTFRLAVLEGRPQPASHSISQPFSQAGPQQPSACRLLPIVMPSVSQLLGGVVFRYSFAAGAAACCCPQLVVSACKGLGVVPMTAAGGCVCSECGLGGFWRYMTGPRGGPLQHPC